MLSSKADAEDLSVCLMNRLLDPDCFLSIPKPIWPVLSIELLLQGLKKLQLNEQFMPWPPSSWYGDGAMVDGVRALTAPI